MSDQDCVPEPKSRPAGWAAYCDAARALMAPAHARPETSKTARSQEALDARCR